MKYHVPIPLESQEEYLYHTFMDTLGRTAIKMTAVNVVDEQHKKELIVSFTFQFAAPLLMAQVTYNYPAMAAYRKPFVIFTGVLTLFTFSWIISKIDVRIGK